MQREEKTPGHNPAQEGRQQYKDSLGVNRPRCLMHTENLSPSASGSRERAPEFGDAADPTSGEIGAHHRDK